VRLAPRTDLRQLGALLARATLMVSGDTGPLHLAAALRVPCVAMFGPTAPERNGPYGDQHVALVDERPLECRPCWALRCARGDLACLERIAADRVYSECLAALERDELEP
jgi:ADP-heptose:LPS heptosyltransferase